MSPDGPYPPDDAWRTAVARRLGRPVAEVSPTGRTPLAGGYHGGVERVELAGGGAVVVKRARPAEVAAMRAVAVVRGVEHPRLLAAGADWIVTDFHDGVPLAEGPDVPAALWVTLARVHAHWWRRRPRGLPVTDGAWWRHLCLARIRPHLEAAAARDDAAPYRRGADLLTAWAEHPGMHAALAGLPLTLTHGDTHRGNVLVTAAGPVLLDWGNARVAPAGFDLVVLRAQGAVDPEPYLAELARLAGPLPPGLLGAGSPGEACADAWAHVGYLGFAADHLGPERVEEMLDGAAGALARLRR